MTIIIKVCPNCGCRNVINRNVISNTREKDKPFGFLGEQLTIVEGDDIKCKECGEWLTE